VSVAIVVGTVAAVLLVAAVVGIARKGRNPSAAGDPSALRDAFVGILMTVGPFFGVRYQPPRVEVPVVMAPAPDDLDPATAAPRQGDDEGAREEV
jgi:hypothetical protein